jgi:hypothetical protein
MSQPQKRTQKKISAPMIVTRTLANTTMETRERAALIAFQFGVAQECHYDDLRYMMNLLLIAGQTAASRKYALDYAQNTIKPTMISIHNRHLKTGNLAVDDDGKELATLAEMVDFNLQFWLRQTTQLFKYCCIELDQFNQSLQKAH